MVSLRADGFRTKIKKQRLRNVESVALENTTACIYHVTTDANYKVIVLECTLHTVKR